MRSKFNLVNKEKKGEFSWPCAHPRKKFFFREGEYFHVNNSGGLILEK